MPGETILVIDDSKATLDFVVNYILKPNGFESLVARDGEEGIRLALTQLPDLIILDLEMPKVNGLEVLKTLQKRALSIPVILSTAHGSEDIAIEVFRMGVRDYVTKPYEVEEMAHVIERALAETRAKRERDDLFARLVQTNRSLEARLRELSTLYGISKSVTALLDHETLLRRVVEAAQFVTGAQSCLLRLRDVQSGLLRIQAIIGTRENGHGQESDDLTQQVMRTGLAAITPTAVAVPMKVGSKLIGTLDVSNASLSRAFIDHDMHLLQALADYAAIAIENSRLFRELEESKEREKQTIRNVFERYVTPAVVDQLLSSPRMIQLGGARQPITTLFADIRGFTSLAEHLKPEMLFETLNHHLSLGAEAVLTFEGTLDKFMGDSIMAFFNAPLPQTDYALRAVKAAVEMQQRITTHSKTMPEGLRLLFGVGIATGEAVVGNIGTAELMNYTAIGHTVNLARRLQEVAKGGQILIDETTYRAVTANVKARALGAADIKGFSAQVQVYEVIGLK
jgi:class 3 adenylate cyclase/DNA-binding response OmpR family regulator